MSLLLGCSLPGGESEISPAEDPVQTDAHNYFVKGVEHATAGRYLQAITELDKVLHLNSGDAYAYLGRGQSNFGLERYGKAVVDFNKAISLLPQEAHAFVLLNIGFAQYHGGNTAEAIVAFDQVLDLEGNWMTYVHRGIAKHDLGQYMAAISDYNEYIRRNPDEGYPYFLKGFAKYELNCFEEALHDLNQANLLLPHVDEIVSMQEGVLALLQFNDSSPSICRDF